ncbi:MAG TPA: Gfo/Idh/MocA family oxidoreductase [Gemmatimonadaceae bacterium]
MAPAPIRFAVIGLGDIAQRAVLPAFDHARSRASLTALVSGTPKKRRVLGRRFADVISCGYKDYDALLASGAVDAVYIALPNEMHADFAHRAMEAGVHVLCEKPMATTVADARAMRRAAERTGVQFMVAYRLHFDPATLQAIAAARDRRAGELRLMASVFSSPVERGDIRLTREGRGGLFDLGIYCVNAARMVFRSEPIDVVAMHAGQGRGRFREVPEMTAALLRYPGERMATFVCSLNAWRNSSWTAVSRKRQVWLEPAYTYRDPFVMEIRSDSGTRSRRFGVHDQFAAELDHFVARIRSGRKAEPSVREGEADIRILDAIDRSARTGRRVRLQGIPRDAHPSPRQARAHPPVGQVRLVDG